MQTQIVLAQRAKEPFYTYRPIPNDQTRFVLATVQMNPGVYVLMGGNRTGKTKSCCWVFAYWALRALSRVREMTGESPVLWQISKTYEDGGEIIWKQTLSSLIHPRNIEAISWHNKTKEWPAYVRTTSGVEILFKAWEQRRGAFQGRAIAGAYFDEQFPKDVMGEVGARCVDLSAPIICGLTPVDPDPFLEEKYSDAPAGWNFYSIDLDDNRQSRGGYMPDDAVNMFLENNRGTDLYETRKSGAMVGLQGAVYKSFRRTLHVLPAAQVDGAIIERGQLWHRAWGVDFGVNNPFCCLWGALDEDGRWWIYDELYEPQRAIETLCAEIRHRNCHDWAIETAPGISRPPEGAFWADTGDTSMTTAGPDYRVSGRRKMQEHGIHVQPANKDMMKGIEIVQRALRIPTAFDSRGRPAVVTDELPMLVISDRCKNLARQMSVLRWHKPKMSDSDPLEKTVKVDDHATDALRYMLASEHRASAMLSVGKGGQYDLARFGFPR